MGQSLLRSARKELATLRSWISKLDAAPTTSIGHIPKFRKDEFLHIRDAKIGYLRIKFPHIDAATEVLRYDLRDEAMARSALKAICMADPLLPDLHLLI